MCSSVRGRIRMSPGLVKFSRLPRVRLGGLLGRLPSHTRKQAGPPQADGQWWRGIRPSCRSPSPCRWSLSRGSPSSVTSQTENTLHITPPRLMGERRWPRWSGWTVWFKTGVSSRPRSWQPRSWCSVPSVLQVTVLGLSLTQNWADYGIYPSLCSTHSLRGGRRRLFMLYSGQPPPKFFSQGPISY